MYGKKDTVVSANHLKKQNMLLQGEREGAIGNPKI
jgi:hypothetical protein